MTVIAKIKKIVVILCVVIVSLNLFCGCSVDNTVQAGTKDNERIIITNYDYLNDDGNFNYGVGTYVLVDKDTDIEYLVVRSGDGVAITPLYDSDGQFKAMK